MQELKTSFHKNDLPYTLIMSNDVVALYGVGGTYTDKILHYEVCELHYRDDMYGQRMSLPSNEEFGKDKSRAIVNRDEAVEYYEELTRLFATPDPENLTRGRDNTQKEYLAPTLI